MRPRANPVANHLPAPRRLALPALLLGLAAGCGGDNGRLPVYPVKGAVFVKAQPAAGARVFFSPAAAATDPQALRPFAVADADGSFRLTTYTAYDGAPAGDYVVILTWPSRLPAVGADDGPASPDRLRGAYGDPRKPKLRATVRPEPTTLEPFRID